MREPVWRGWDPRDFYIKYNKVRVLGPMMVPSALPVIVTARHLCVHLGVVGETSINFLVPRFVSVFVTVSLTTFFQR